MISFSFGVSYLFIARKIDERFRLVYTVIRLNFIDGCVFLLEEEWDYLISAVCSY